jgi:NAD(P)H-flavin reductase
VGDVIDVEGPLGKFDYQPGGTVVTNDFTTKAKRIFFIAGGSGITPCYQIIKEIVNMKDEDIELILLFANK